MANRAVKTNKAETAKNKELKGVRVCGSFGVWGTYFSGNNRFAYSTSITQKSDDGTRAIEYFDVVFPKKDDVEYEGLHEVKVNDGFITFYDKKNGERIFKIVLLDYEIVAGE